MTATPNGIRRALIAAGMPPTVAKRCSGSEFIDPELPIGPQVAELQTELPTLFGSEPAPDSDDEPSPESALSRFYEQKRNSREAIREGKQTATGAAADILKVKGSRPPLDNSSKATKATVSRLGGRRENLPPVRVFEPRKLNPAPVKAKPSAATQAAVEALKPKPKN
ncbi:hypothetical protein [Streptomyces sp. SPB4]|uniref:hypothetical protein n=1 Tax=Streptomyces sp. SPB4 TaxID=2940553 RepID=UPI00247579E1|nr:hypothetical protein [Streptomyces sp. SPB4]MDH6537810.1 hypothetical protein [Streptomyces sp. SPB4]